MLGKSLTRKQNKRVDTAFERSIELASFHVDDGPKISLQRHAAYSAYLLKTRNPSKASSQLHIAEEIAKQAGLSENKEFAEILVLKAEMAYDMKQFDRANTSVDAAIHLFTLLETTPSVNFYRAQSRKAQINSELGNWQEALRGYEAIYMNVDRHIDEQHPIIGHSYVKKIGWFPA